MEEFLTRFGLLAIFVAAAIEGDVCMLLAGVVAHLGLVHPVAAAAVGALGGFVGDAAWFQAGRHGAHVVRDRAAYARFAARVDRIVGRLGDKELLLARLVYGTRLVSMLYWGARGLPFTRFVVLDLPACAIWAATLTALGWLSSSSISLLLGRVRHVEEWLLAALLASVTAVVVGRSFMQRVLHRAAE